MSISISKALNGMTTQKMLEMETANLQKLEAGQNTQQPITEGVAEKLTTSQGVTLSESQREAVSQIVTSRDQIIGLQGGAGTGKTTALEAVREAAEHAGYDVQGFAPTTRATQLLAESGIQTRTLQKFIRQKAEPDAPKRFYVIDESSLVSSKALNSFLSRVRPEDRVLLVGDVKQHEAIEAGSPFVRFQHHGMETAKLEKIVRQKDAPLREIVENLSIGKIKEAVEGLHKQGRITEIADPDERLKTIAKDYCEQPKSTLVVSPANKERVELNQLIHQQLQRSGQISKRDYRTKVLENRNDMTGAERTFAAAYHPDDIIRYTSASKKHGVNAGEYARVISTNDKDNTITVKLEKSEREVSYNPQRLQGVTVYREAEREFSIGDRLQFRAPHHPERIANGELGTLEKIERGRLTVALDSGRKVDFDIDKNRHIDHGYAVTSHSAQGQTIDRVLINADTHESDKLLNQRMRYVASSRARLDARIYTDSEERLSAALARQVDKSTALEASREAHETKVRNVARLVPIEEAVLTPQPMHVLQQVRESPGSRPPAQRAPREVVRQPAVMQAGERLKNETLAVRATGREIVSAARSLDAMLKAGGLQAADAVRETVVTTDANAIVTIALPSRSLGNAENDISVKPLEAALTTQEQDVLKKFDEVVQIVNDTYKNRDGNSELRPEIKLAIAEQAAESSLRPVVNSQIAAINYVASAESIEPPSFENRVEASVWLVKQSKKWREQWADTMIASAEDNAAARLLARNRLAELTQAATEKRARDFEGTSHLRRFHIEGHDQNDYSKAEAKEKPRDANYQWSLNDVAEATREAKKNESDYNRQANQYEAHADITKLFKRMANNHLNPLAHIEMSSKLLTNPVSSINMHFNPVKLIERDPLVQIGRFVFEAAGAQRKATALREKAKVEASKVARLEAEVRPEVIKQTNVARTEIQQKVAESREATRAFNASVEQEVTARAAKNVRMPKASFREEEIREVGARAMELSDGTVLKQYEKLAQAGQASGLLQEESLAARAGARQTVAAARVLEAQGKLAEFSKPIGTDGMTAREVTPVKVEIEGEVRVMTLRDAMGEPEAIKELIESRLAATEESLRAKVTKRREFYETARAIATKYEADLAARAGVESVRPPLPQFSAEEYTEIENFTASIKDARLHKRFTEISESAIKDNRVIGSEKAVDAALDPVLKLDEEIGTGAAAEDIAIASAAPEINAVDGLMKTPSPALDALQRNAVSETIEKTITGELQKTINELLQKRASYVPPPVPDTIPLRPYTLIEPSDAAEDLSMAHTSLNDSLSHSEAIENRPQAASTEQAIGSEAATEEIELEEFIEAGIEM